MPVAPAPGFMATATSRIRRRSTPRLMVAVVLVVRLGFVFAFHIHSHLVGQGGFNASPYGGLDDGRYYYETATKLANGTQPDYVLNAFPRVLAFLMRLGIRDLLALKLISYAISSIAVILAATLVWHLTRHLEEAARRWAVIVVSVVGGLFPSNVFWSLNSIMRDGWILSLVLIFLWGTSTAPPYVHRLVRWSIALAALAAAGVFRFYVVPVALAALVSARVPFANPMRGWRPAWCRCWCGSSWWPSRSSSALCSSLPSQPASDSTSSGGARSPNSSARAARSATRSRTKTR